MVASAAFTFAVLACVCCIVFAEEHHLDVDASVTQSTESTGAHKFIVLTPSDHSASLNVEACGKGGEVYLEAREVYQGSTIQLGSHTCPSLIKIEKNLS